MSFLLDVNVLVALIDPGHVAHEAAHLWFGEDGSSDWATCPMTENAVVRIVGNPKYPNSPGSPAAVAQILQQMRNLRGHRFWPDEVSLIDSPDVDLAQMHTPGQVTDTYLLALAAAHGGRLATFDRRLSTKAVRGGARTVFLIEARPER